MISHARKSLAACLAVLVLLGSVQMAVARGAPVPVGTMVICAGHGVSVVLVDADGQPTRAAHLCPDCAFASYGPLAEPVEIAPAVFVLLPQAYAAPGRRWSGLSEPATSARDPPLPA